MFHVEISDNLIPALLVNGVEKPRLYLEIDKEYTFMIHTNEHPFYITENPMTGPNDDTNWEEKYGSPKNKGEFRFKTDSTMNGKTLYYGTRNSTNMGYKIVISH